MSLLKETNLFKEIFTATLSMLVEDNIQYAELRAPFGYKWDKNGTKIPQEQVLEFMQKQIELYKNNHPNFYGVKFIFAMSRGVAKNKDLRKSLNTANDLSKQSDLVRGFDLVGNEETGRSLNYFQSTFLKFRSLPFVFHAGETLWTGFDVDRNVLDAVLLGTKRIG